MKEIPELLYNNISTITDNITTYKNNGYFIVYNINNNVLSITYNDKLYEVKIVKKDYDYYWHLSPYNDSYFLTNFYNPSSFDMVLFAIKENDTLYNSKN